jgi:hypothetical protein
VVFRGFVVVGYFGAGVRFYAICFYFAFSFCYTPAFVVGCLAAFCLSLFISLAMTISTYLFIIAYSSSTPSISYFYSCSGSFVTVSFPFFVSCCGGFAFAGRVSALGSGWVEVLCVWCSVPWVMVVSGAFLSCATLTCSSMMAYTIFVGFMVSGSNLAILSIFMFRACTVSSTLFYFAISSTLGMCVNLFSFCVVCSATFCS